MSIVKPCEYPVKTLSKPCQHSHPNTPPFHVKHSHQKRERERERATPPPELAPEEEPALAGPLESILMSRYYFGGGRKRGKDGGGPSPVGPVGPPVGPTRGRQDIPRKRPPRGGQRPQVLNAAAGKYYVPCVNMCTKLGVFVLFCCVTCVSFFGDAGNTCFFLPYI